MFYLLIKTEKPFTPLSSEVNGFCRFTELVLC